MVVAWQTLRGHLMMSVKHKVDILWPGMSRGELARSLRLVAAGATLSPCAHVITLEIKTVGKLAEAIEPRGDTGEPPGPCTGFAPGRQVP